VEFIDKTLEIASDGNSLLDALVQFICFEILGKIENLEQGLEHPGGRPGRRDEFHEPTLAGSRCVQTDTLLQISIFDSPDTVTKGARFLETDEKIRAPKGVNLPEHH
jgi:hypothetical protein